MSVLTWILAWSVVAITRQRMHAAFGPQPQKPHRFSTVMPTQVMPTQIAPDRTARWHQIGYRESAFWTNSNDPFLRNQGVKLPESGFPIVGVVSRRG